MRVSIWATEDVYELTLQSHTSGRLQAISSQQPSLRQLIFPATLWLRTVKDHVIEGSVNHVKLLYHQPAAANHNHPITLPPTARSW